MASPAFSAGPILAASRTSRRPSAAAGPAHSTTTAVPRGAASGRTIRAIVKWIHPVKGNGFPKPAIVTVAFAAGRLDPA